MILTPQELIDSGRAYLGKLCSLNHEYEDTGKTLRYKSKWQCIECKKIADAEYKSKNREKVLQHKKNYYEANKESHCARVKEYRIANKDKIDETVKQWKLRNPDKRKATQQRYREKHKEQIKERSKAYQKKTQHIKNVRTQNYRAKKRSVTLYPITSEQTEKLFNDFDNKCAYCNDPMEGLRRRQLDHFIPLNKGGTHTIGNLIPCCISCNSSKVDHDPVEWFKSRPSYSDKKLKRILKYLGKTINNYNQLTLL